MAIRTLAEGQPRVTRLGVGTRGVALLAPHLSMQSGERKTRPGVIELSGGVLPVGAVVTLRAFCAQPSVVRVLVAACTPWAQSKKGPAQILNSDR